MPKITNWRVIQDGEEWENTETEVIVYVDWKRDKSEYMVYAEVKPDDPEKGVTRKLNEENFTSKKEAQEFARTWMKNHRFGTTGDSHLSTLIRRVLGASPEHALWGQFKRNLRQYPNEWDDYSEYEMSMRDQVIGELRSSKGRKPCPRCDGAGKTMYQDEGEDCPRCDGTGKVRK